MQNVTLVYSSEKTLAIFKGVPLPCKHKHVNNIYTTLTLARHCINVIQIFRIYSVFSPVFKPVRSFAHPLLGEPVLRNRDTNVRKI